MSTSHGTTTLHLLGMVEVLTREQKADIQYSATAKMTLFNRDGGKTVVEIPVTGIESNLRCGERYEIAITFRRI